MNPSGMYIHPASSHHPLKRTAMKSVFISLVFLTMASAALANTAPTVLIQSATMRPGTTLMDVVYRVNDPDNATVKTRALAFVDGVRSFANVIRPVTFVEGTAAKLGDAIPANVNHTLTWDVAADWDVDLGQVKFEVLAMDGRGLLPFDWITIPAAGGYPAMTISKNSPTDTQVLNALFWQYASGDSWLSLADGILAGNSSSGVFSNYALVDGNVIQAYSAPYLLKRINLDPANSTEIAYTVNNARAGLLTTSNWHAVNRTYTGVSMIFGWGSNNYGQATIPAGLNGVIAIAAGNSHSLALKSDGTVFGWGYNNYGQTTIPAGLSGVIAIAAGTNHSLALKSDGTVVGWGENFSGQTTIPAGLSGVTAIAAGSRNSFAVKSDGSAVGWGFNNGGHLTIPDGLTGVTNIAASHNGVLALKSNGTVTGWGSDEIKDVPAGMAGVIAISAGYRHAIALKSNGTVVGWGYSSYGATTIPAGLTGVTAIAAGFGHSLALKNDGTVVCWGKFKDGSGAYPSMNTPAGLSGVTLIGKGCDAGQALAVKAKAL
jgi:hypothetical protein